MLVKHWPHGEGLAADGADGGAVDVAHVSAHVVLVREPRAAQRTFVLLGRVGLVTRKRVEDRVYKE